MLDKTSKRVLSTIQKLSNNQVVELRLCDLEDECNLSEESLLRVCQYLESRGLVDVIIRDRPGVAWYHAVYLTHVGLHQKEFSGIGFLKYLAQHWIAILALAVAAGSFVVSVVALLR